MKRPLTFLLAAVLLAVPAASPALATSITYSAALSGPNESPANASPGTGTATVTIDDVLNTMRVQVTFSDLLGNVTASHIHCCTTVPFVGTAGVATTTPTFTAFPSGVTSGTYDHTFDLTLAGSFNPAFVTAHGGTAAGATAFLLAGMANGQSYLNIHTNLYTGGEIRGFLQPVPDDADSLLLLGTSVAGLLGFALRQRGA